MGRSFDFTAGPVQSVTAPEKNLRVDTLLTCQAYWVTATAVTCGSSISSEAAYIDVYDRKEFEAVITLGSNGPCSTWVTTDLERKHIDAQNFVLEALNNACGYQVPCTANNTFTCDPQDETKVNFIATLVGTESVPSQLQVQCLVEWTIGGGPDGRDVVIDGDKLNADNIGQTEAPAGGTTGGGLNVWVYVVIAIAVVGVILILLIVFVISASRRKEKRKLGERRLDHDMDDMDDAHSVYSIGIVENPIFADDAKPKGKELEANMDDAKDEKQKTWI